MISLGEARELSYKKKDSGYQIIKQESPDFTVINEKLRSQLSKGVSGFFGGKTGNFFLTIPADEKISKVTQSSSKTMKVNF